MKSLQRTKQFKKDVKRLQKQGKDFTVLKAIIDKLRKGELLEARYLDHELKGKYKGVRECHLTSDWLVIYEISETIIKLRRTGSHSELFKE